MADRNRELALRWMEEIWNQRKAEVVDELMHEEAVGHMEGGDARGPAGFKVVHSVMLQAIPDLRIEVEDSVAEGDAVVLRWRVGGTHRGEGLGIPPSGRTVDAHGMSWFRIRDGRMVEGWDSWNIDGFMAALARP